MRGLTSIAWASLRKRSLLLQNARDWSATSKVNPSYVLALCYMDVRRFDDARHAFAHQYGLSQTLPQPISLRDACCSAERSFSPRKRLPARLWRLNPQIPLAHLLLGEIALSQQHLDEAVAEMERNAPSTHWMAAWSTIGSATPTHAQMNMKRLNSPSSALCSSA